MFIELPNPLVAVPDLLIDPGAAADGPQTVTALGATRAARGAQAPSRIRLATSRGAHWSSHASVDAGEGFELTFTAGA